MKSILRVLSFAYAAVCLGVSAETTDICRKAVDFEPRAGIGNVMAKIAAGETVRLAYFGGSITAQDGWRVFTREWLQQEYPNATFAEINAAIGGTGSPLGVYRLGHDVLRHDPDLVFVEFATNDAGQKPETIWRNFDGIVRQVWRKNPRTDIVFCYTITSAMTNDYAAGNCNRAAAAMEELADYYGIPSVSFGPRVMREAQAGRLAMKAAKDAGEVKAFAADGVHPTPYGHRLYLASFQEGWHAMKGLPAVDHASKLGKPFRDATLERAKLVPIDRSMLTGDWSQVTSITNENMAYFNRLLGDVWGTEKPGGTIRFTFRGTDAGLYELMGPAGGKLDVRIDGRPVGTRTLCDKFCSYWRLASCSLYSGAEGTHTVEVTLSSEIPDRAKIVGASRVKADPEKYAGTRLMAGQIMLVGDLVTVFHADARAAADGDGSAAKPWRTPADVVRGVRAARQSGRVKRGTAVDVRFAAGDYLVTDGIELGKDDAGAADAPVRWLGATEERTRFVGGVRVPAESFRPMTDASLLARLPEEAKGKVFVADVAPLVPGRIPAPAERFDTMPPAPLLFVGGSFGTLARWPNDGYTTFTQRVDQGTFVRKHPNGRTERKPGAFVYAHPRAKRWRFDEGVWLNGYWTHDWRNESVRVARYGIENGTNDIVRLAADVTGGVMGVPWQHKPRRFYAFNLFDEIDRPGEWWLDRDRKQLYLYPPEGAPQATDEAVLVFSGRPLVRADGVAGLRFERIDFAYGYGDGVSLRGSDLRLTDCRIANFCGSGAVVTGDRNLVRNIEVCNVGRKGLVVSGGDRRLIVKAETAVENCRFHDWAAYQRTYAPAIEVSGCGIVLRGNVMYDAPHSAVIYSGNEHLFERNEAYRVLMETGDAGAYYTGRDWTTQGNVLRFNYTHDLGDGGKGADTMGFYFDDCDCGDAVYGNVFHNVSRGIMVGGGRDHPIRNNIFSHCRIGLSVDCRGLRWKQWNSLEHGGTSWLLEKKAQAFDYTNGVWAAAYPRLAKIMEDHPREPLGNPVENNVFIDCSEKLLALDKQADACLSRMAPIASNLVVNSFSTNRVQTAQPDPRIASGFHIVDGAPVATPREVADAQAWRAGGRAKALAWFRDEMFGRLPAGLAKRPYGRPADERIGARNVSCAGGRIDIKVHLSLPDGADGEHPVPVVVFGDHSNPAVSTWGSVLPGIPTNTITRRGYAYVSWNFNDVAPNVYQKPGESPKDPATAWSNGVFKVYGGGGARDWGTLAAWAWGFSRVMDWIETRPELDAKRVMVVGHSRGGKTALWAGAQDERIAMAVSNDSGTGGARCQAAPDLPKAETFGFMLNGPIHFWFCPQFRSWLGKEKQLPYDAPDLLKLIAPRLVYVASGSEDAWAGPAGEYESAVRASALWRGLGERGLALHGAFETAVFPGIRDHSGKVGYHLRPGLHKILPYDWDRYLDFADLHLHR